MMSNEQQTDCTGYALCLTEDEHQSVIKAAALENKSFDDYCREAVLNAACATLRNAANALLDSIRNRHQNQESQADTPLATSDAAPANPNTTDCPTCHGSGKLPVVHV